MARSNWEPIPELSLGLIHRIARVQMNMSDVCIFLVYHYCEETTMTAFGAYIQDKASIKWSNAKNILRYIAMRGSKICITNDQRPNIDYQDRVQCLEAILNLEQELTEILKDLHTKAYRIGDSDTLIFVRELMTNQKKSEKLMEKEIAKLKNRSEQAQQERKEMEKHL